VINMIKADHLTGGEWSKEDRGSAQGEREGGGGRKGEIEGDRESLELDHKLLQLLGFDPRVGA
jgi:hypothetical protein